MKVKHILFGEDVIDVNVGQSINTTKGEGARLALVNPTLSFTPQFVPSTFSFSALIMMQGIPETNTNIKIEFENKTSNKVIFSVNSLIPSTIPNNPNIPQHLAGLNMNVPLKNIPIEHEGSYEFKVYLNEELSATEELVIIKK